MEVIKLIATGDPTEPPSEEGGETQEEFGASAIMFGHWVGMEKDEQVMATETLRNSYSPLIGIN